VWECPQCLGELGDYNAYCEYCLFESDNTIIYNPDKYYIRDICIYALSQGAKSLTPQEELFAQLFNHEKVLVRDMDTLTLRAHREELAKIAFEARARLTAVDDEDQTRKRKSSNGSVKGFERSVNTDETTTNAINAIKERQKKLSKKEQVQEQLKKLYEMAGSSDAVKLAAETASNAKISEVLNKKDDNVQGPLNAPFIIVAKEPQEPNSSPSVSKPLFNPFAKKNE